MATFRSTTELLPLILKVLYYNNINAQINKSLTSTNNVVEQLKELKEMYKYGDLTKEEYKKAKKKILD